MGSDIDHRDISSMDYENLVDLEHRLELDLIEVHPRKVHLIQEEEENLKKMHHHIGAGILFSVIKYHGEKMQYLDVDLKNVLVSGFPDVSCVEGLVYEDIPSMPAFCRVGGALFMVGGNLDQTDLRYGYEYKSCSETKWLWTAPVPPIASGGSFTMTWTRCDTAMHSTRKFPMVVPLHDGRIFICGGNSGPECWLEIYDPEKGEFDRRDLPDHILNPNPSSCFLWADQSVMLCYRQVNIEEEECKPSLVLYDVERNNWEIFAEKLPASQSGYWGYDNLIYVGGNILFIIDQASCWFVYDLSAKKEVGKVDVRVEDWDVIKHALYLGNKDMISSSWIFYIFKPNYEKHYCYRDLRYAKVEVIQGQGGDYISTIHFSGILKIGDFNDLYIIADEASIKRAAEDRSKETDEDEKGMKASFGR